LFVLPSKHISFQSNLPISAFPQHFPNAPGRHRVTTAGVRALRRACAKFEALRGRTKQWQGRAWGLNEPFAELMDDRNLLMMEMMDGKYM
jgi:hypothetical protein